MIDLLSRILTLFITNKKRRKEIRNNIKTRLYGKEVFKKAKHIGKGLFISDYSTAGSNTYIGDYVFFNGIKIMGDGRVTIGNHVHCGPECMIIAQTHRYDNAEAIPFDKTYIYKDIEIGNFVWLGARVTILPGTKIGEGAIIQAGAVVHGEVPPCAIIGGNPAKIFKYRNIEEFERLKSEEKFYNLY